MGIVQTDKWIDFIDNPNLVMKKLIIHFPKMNEKTLYKYLSSHGLSELNKTCKEDMKLLMKKNVWIELEKEFQLLKKELNGPDIPIYILPCHQKRGFFQPTTYNRGGVATNKCVFLFLSPIEGILQHKAVLLHEYHHIVRLSKLYKNKSVNLLDAMILEGLAESAVKEKYGVEVQAPWTSYYSSTECEYYFHKILKAKMNLSSEEDEFSIYLYGGKRIPKLLGYCVGYDIVKCCLDQTEWTTNKIIRFSSNKIKENALNYNTN